MCVSQGTCSPQPSRKSPAAPSFACVSAWPAAAMVEMDEDRELTAQLSNWPVGGLLL